MYAFDAALIFIARMSDPRLLIHPWLSLVRRREENISEGGVEMKEGERAGSPFAPDRKLYQPIGVLEAFAPEPVVFTRITPD